VKRHRTWVLAGDRGLGSGMARTRPPATIFGRGRDGRPSAGYRSLRTSSPGINEVTTRRSPDEWAWVELNYRPHADQPTRLGRMLIRPSGCWEQNQLPVRLALFQSTVRLGRLGQRERLLNRHAKPANGHPLLQLAPGGVPPLGPIGSQPEAA
jgi:hypothetical protein